MPFVSVIIPTYNDHDLLPLCLNALEQQTFSDTSYEVIVVDNGSSPPIDEIVSEFSHARLVVEPKRGSYAARNKGIATAKGDIFAFTDSDCIPESDWLEKGVTHLQNCPECGLVGGQVKVFPKTKNPTGVELFEMLYAFDVEAYISHRHYAPTCNLFTTRQVVDQVGMFDPELPSGGDTEWGQRVYAMHYSQIYAPDLVIRHPARRTVAELLKKYKRIAAGRATRLQFEKTLSKMVKHPLFFQDVIPKRGDQFIEKLRKSDYTLSQQLRVFLILMLVYFVSVFEKFRQLCRK